MGRLDDLTQEELFAMKHALENYLKNVSSMMDTWTRVPEPVALEIRASLVLYDETIAVLNEGIRLEDPYNNPWKGLLDDF